MATPPASSDSLHSFNSLFKSHLYYKRSPKEPTEKEDSYQYLYSNSKTPNTRRPSSSRLRLVRVGAVLNHARDGIQSSNEVSYAKENNTSKPTLEKPLSKPGSQINYTKTPFQTAQSKDLMKPKLIKRGKFKGRYDDRLSKCAYRDVPNYNHLKCYCSHKPVVESPLKMQSHNSSALKVAFQIPISDSYNGSESNVDTTSFKCKDSRLITRVRQKFVNSGFTENGSYDFGFSSPTRRSVRKIQSLNNIRRFGLHSKAPEESEVNVIELETQELSHRKSFGSCPIEQQPILV